jgi:uncharacterized membrane protein YfcA
MILSKYNLLLMLLGVIVGFLNASLGLGGGLIVIPFLVVLLKTDLKESMLLSLTTIVVTSTISLITHSIMNFENIMFQTALYMIPGTIVGSKIGAYLSTKIRTKVLTKVFAIIIIISGAKVVGVFDFSSIETSSLALYYYPIAGLVIGTIAALFGIGGGILIVPFVMFATDFSMSQIVPTSIAVILPTTLVSSYFRLKYQKLNTQKLKYIVSTVVIGSMLGAYFNNHMPEQMIKIMVGIIIVISAMKMLRK